MTIRSSEDESCAISADGVSYTYPSGIAALRDVSFSLASGSLLGIIGPNGAGKTTLVKILCGLRRPQAGSVVYRLGDRHEPLRPTDIRSRLAVVHQAPAFDMFLTLRMNILNYVLLRKARVDDLSKRMRDLGDALGIAECLDRPALELSGGQLRKGQILRAILILPQLMVLDEPTSALDVKSRRTVWGLINELREVNGTTVVWTSHEIPEMERRADQLLLLHQGRVQWFGSFDNLRAASSVSRVEVEAEDGRDILKNLPRRHVLDVEKMSRTGSRILVSTDGAREVVDFIMRQSGVLGVATRAPSLEDLLIAIDRISLPHDITSRKEDAE